MTRNRTEIDRRLLLGATSLAIAGVAGQVSAQQPKSGGTTGGAPAPTRRLSRAASEFIASFDLASVPAEVVDIARIGFIDALGVMLAGSREEAAHLAFDMVKLESAAPTVTVVGHGLRTSPQLAAFANGVAVHAMDYDFTFISGQSMAAVVPALLAVAEGAGASPRECISAFIVGAEVTARVVRSNYTASSLGGWHTTGMVGVIGATAACARLLKLPADKIEHAIGIAVSLASGVSVNFGTMSKPLHCGNAARNGVMAAHLAARGYTASPIALEGRSGYFTTYGRGLKVSTEPFDDLGRRWDLVAERLQIKAYPCGGLTHTTIEAALEHRKTLGGRLGDIKAIHCSVTANAGQRAGTQWPATTENAKFSVAYLAAYALVHGAPGIPAFTEKALADEKVKAIASLVTASIDPALGPGTGGSPAIVRVTLADGKVVEQRRDFSSGSPQSPMTPAQLEAKFADCAAQAISADAARQLLGVLNGLASRASMADLWPLLRGA